MLGQVVQRQRNRRGHQRRCECLTRLEHRYIPPLVPTRFLPVFDDVNQGTLPQVPFGGEVGGEENQGQRSVFCPPAYSHNLFKSINACKTNLLLGMTMKLNTRPRTLAESEHEREQRRRCESRAREEAEREKRLVLQGRARITREHLRLAFPPVPCITHRKLYTMLDRLIP